MNKLKQLAGETVLYGLGSIVPRFLNFLLVSLHTGVFAPAEYGVITKLLAYVGVLNTVYMFGMETAYFRFASKPGADEQKIFNLAQTVVLSISGSLTVIFILFASSIADLLQMPSRPDLVIALALIMFIDAVVAIPFARLRLQKKGRQFAAFKLTNIFVLVGLNVYFLRLAPGMVTDVGFVFLANLIANGMYILFFARMLISWRTAYDRDLSPRMFAYAYPIMFTGLAGMTNEMFSRITLDAWLPPHFYPGRSNEAALGIFGACYKLAMLMSLAIQAFRYAAEPFFFSQATEKNSPQLFARINHYFTIVCCLLLLSASINLDILKYFLGQPAYWEGINIVPILLLAYLFNGIYYNFTIWYKLTDKTYWGTILTVGGMIVTIGANYFLIPLFGYTGSSWAALLCYFSMTVACYLIGKKYYPVPYAIGKGIAYIAITIFIVYAVNAVFLSSQVLATTFHIVVIILYLCGVYLIERKHFRTVQA
jgi:O-antigen/teichoic acid export membrane protein